MYQTIEDINIENKTVLVRVDYNVPIKDGVITDNTRIVKSLKTLNYLIDKNCKIVLISHLGKIKTEEDKKKNSLYIVKEELSKIFNKDIEFVDNYENIKDVIANMSNKDIILLENTRFFDLDGKKESNADDELSKFYSSLADIFVNDAFGTIHRKHASNFGVSKYLPSYIGYLIEEELNGLSKLNDVKDEYVVILGGSKISDKTLLIKKLLNKCNHILIGGGMSFTFLKALGYNVGKSIVDDENIDYCKELLDIYKDKIVLPIDFVCNNEFKDKPGKLLNISEIDNDMMGLDIGPKTVIKFSDYIYKAKTIMWNGPLGVYEFNNYQNGTKEILKVLSKSNSYKVAGGGDIVSAVNNLGYNKIFDHISTGGGATLSYLQGDELPGLINIKKKGI